MTRDNTTFPHDNIHFCWYLANAPRNMSPLQVLFDDDFWSTSVPEASFQLNEVTDQATSSKDCPEELMHMAMHTGTVRAHKFAVAQTNHYNFVKI